MENEKKTSKRKDPLNDNTKTKTFFTTNKTLVKSIISIILLLSVSINCIMGVLLLPSDDIECINDATHNYTENLNKFLNENIFITNLITIVSSLCIDIIMVGGCVLWVNKSKSWRFLITLIIFYCSRGLIQALFQMKYPVGFIWNYPGLPSLAVSYLKTSDFFFSGHVGLPIIVACEYFKYKSYKMGYFSIFACILEFIVMTLMRGHYIIDLIFGIITAHYIFIMVDKYIHIIDDSFITLKHEFNDTLIKKTYSEKLKLDQKFSTTTSDEDKCD